MPNLDITKTNAAIDRLLEEKQNPRHRFLLQAYHRHRFLEIAGRYDEIFAPDMMAKIPTYHFQANGIDAKLEGQDAVKSLYRTWAETNQSIFYVENEQVAVANNFIASVVTAHQQVWGRAIWVNKALSVLPSFISERVLKKMLTGRGWRADENAMYLYTTTVEMIWSYDDRGRRSARTYGNPTPIKPSLPSSTPKTS
jgi:predicted metallopeptidase